MVEQQWQQKKRLKVEFLNENCLFTVGEWKFVGEA